MQSELGRLRHKFREGRAELFPPESRLLPCRELLQNHANFIDSLVSEIYEISCALADREVKRTPRSGLAIVATGGYGRKELNPFSDIDIAFIPSEESDPWVEAVVHMAFKVVMDVFLSFREVRVGYSYRAVSELATWDSATLTSLLDARHLCGDPHLSASLSSELRRHLAPLDLVLEINPRQDRVSTLPWIGLYSVEPNLKEGRGALRDLHRGRWLYKLLLGIEDRQLYPAATARNYLPRDFLPRIEAAAEWFWQARNWLHLVAGKRSDVLITNYQDRIAHELGNCSAQDWLSRHYAHSEILALFLDGAVRSVLQGPLDLGGVYLENGCLHLRSPEDRPGQIAGTRLVHLSQRFNIPISLCDLHGLDAAKDRSSGTRASDDEIWAFRGVLSEDRNVSNTLRLLARLGLLDRFIQGFSNLMRFVPPDPAHRHTVGDHSLRVVENLEDLRQGRDARGQHFSELLAQCAHFDVLCLAALLHDSGKLIPGRDHSESGIELTRSVGRLLKLAPEKQELLEILVRHHLLLVRTARLQNLKSAAVIQSIAEKFPNPEALRHLYVFTYVDTRAVAENNWTSMDFRDLEELYVKVLKAKSGLSTEDSPPPSVKDRIVQIRRRLAASEESIDESAISRHCDEMPADYVLNTPLEEIAFHLQLLRRIESEKVVLNIYNRPGDDYSELTVCTFDDPQPGMLAKITGVLYGCDADIHKAQVFTMERARPVALDTLWIRAGGMQISENRARKIQAALREVLVGDSTMEEYLKKAGKNPPDRIPVDSLELRNDLSEEHTVAHIIARDLQGLLYVMTRALSRSGLHIHMAKVATWNGRAENNFYVTTTSGRQILNDDLAQWESRLSRTFQGTGFEESAC